MKKHILVVDDDRRLRDLLRRYLVQDQSWLVNTASSVEEARKALNFFHFDSLVVDVMMPGEPGTALLTDQPLPPVLMLSAMGEPEHRIHGLELGAHDYLIKPFEPRELVLRLTNMMRQSSPLLALGNRLYCCRRKILMTKDHIPIPLSQGESRLLAYLAMRPYQALSRETIVKALFPSALNARIVDVQINRLRKKVEEKPEEPRYLISVRGQGYGLNPMG